MLLRVGSKSFSFIVYWVFDAWLAIRRQPSRKSGIALVRLDAIGDFVLWLDAAKEFRRIFPNRRTVLIANSAWEDLARDFPYWDEVWGVDVRKFVRNIPYRWGVLSKIRQEGFEIAVHPTFSRTFMHGDSVIRATAAVERIGSAGDLVNISSTAKKISDRWYTRLVPANPMPLMELERNAEFIRGLTGGPFRAAIAQIKPEGQQAQERSDREYAIIFPGASWVGRRWPPTAFAEIAARLHEKYGWQTVLCGSSGDYALCKTIAEISRAPCLNLAGKTTLSELAELIRNANLLISNETSAVHIAATVETAAVCILGGGHHGRFMPYPEDLPGVKPLAADHPMPCFNCNWHCTQPRDPAGAVPCVSRVSVEQVLRLAEKAIDMAQKPNLESSYATTSNS